MRLTKYASMAVFLLFPISASVALAQSVPPAFQKAREARDKAIQTANVAVYDKYSTANFIVVDPTGIPRTLADQNARFKAQAQRGGAQAPAQMPKRMDERIDMYNNDTIVLNWAQENPQGGTARITEVWVKEKGTWKCACARASLVPKKN
jgi:Domain of unknown function (DUF4440)